MPQALKLPIQQAFFDVVLPPSSNDLLVQIHTFIKIANTGKIETVIDQADLVLSVEGIPFKGTLIRPGTTNAIEHFTNFKIGGEISTEVFQNTLSPFRPLARSGTEQILRPGHIKEGFLTFSFPDLKNWSESSPYLIEATHATLSVHDSYGRSHSAKLLSLSIPNGIPRTDRRFT